jgi:hypothetical protein
MLYCYLVKAITKYGPTNIPISYDPDRGAGTLAAALAIECLIRGIVIGEDYDVEYLDSATYHDLIDIPMSAGSVC